MEQLNDLLNKIIRASDGLAPSRPWAATEILRSEQLQAREKTFILNLQENEAGRFLRLIEDQGDYGQKWITLPASSLAELKKQIDEMIKISSQVTENPPH
jgi:hypothetical protein